VACRTEGGLEERFGCRHRVAVTVERNYKATVKHDFWESKRQSNMHVIANNSKKPKSVECALGYGDFRPLCLHSQHSPTRVGAPLYMNLSSMSIFQSRFQFFLQANRMFHESPHSWAYNLLPPDEPDIDSESESDSWSITCQESYDTTLFEEGLKEWPNNTQTDLLSILPFEVISHIFYHACKPIGGNRRWQRDCDPLLLGQLSRRYRRYAWATSELWTTIIIQVIPRKVTIQTELLKEWLARTMGRPIDIYFDIQDTPVSTRWGVSMLLSSKFSNHMQPSIVPMIQLLAKHSLKWQCIEFHIPTNWYPIFTSSTGYPIVANNDEVQPILMQAPLDLPALTSASLHCSDGVMTMVCQGMELDLTLAPSLRALSLSLFQISPAVFARADFKKITILTLDHVYNIVLHDLLQRLPNLQEATFHDAIFLETKEVVHKKLRKLEVDVINERLLRPLVGYVILPRLEMLSICIPTTLDYCTTFRRFTLSNSGSHFTSLSLSCRITREFYLIDVLSALDTLQELYIRDTSTEATPAFGLGCTFFDVFHSEEESPYLPSLEVFSYKGNLIVQAIDFLEPLVVRSRMRSGSSGTDGQLEKFAILKKVKIQADQVSNSAEFSIAEYPDSQFVWEVMMMMERGILELITMDGKCWE